jgi:hypothetical protein
MQPNDRNNSPQTRTGWRRLIRRLPRESANDSTREHWTSTYWAYNVTDRSYNRHNRR